MRITEFVNKKVLIVGMGLEGNSSLAFLRHHHPNITIDTVDQKDGDGYLDHQREYDIAIKSPGVKKELIQIPYTTATNIFFANTQGMTIGVTGTKGKSTTASLIFDMLKATGRRVHLVGNIGNPVLTELMKEEGKEDVYVCELSSYQLEDIEYSPHIAVMVSFFPEHMDYHGSVDLYWKAKSRIVNHLKPDDFFVYNPKFEKLAQLAHGIPARAVPYDESIQLTASKVSLLGKHNLDNVRAALTVGGILGVPLPVMEKAIQSFRPLPHRMEFVGEFAGIRFYDDAISTTPESTTCAIEALENVGTIFLGGQDRGYVFDELARIIDASPIRTIVLFPDSGSRIQDALRMHSSKTYTFLKTRDMRQAVQFAYDKTPTGMICLLSTASPSYSVWKNFEEKGRLFAEYVIALKPKIV